MPRMQADDLAAYLEEPHVAVIATLRADGAEATVRLTVE